MKIPAYFLLLLFISMPPAEAGTWNFGLGLGFVERTQGSGFEGGWDLQIGYEFLQRGNWDLGGQLQLTRGWTSRSSLDDEYAMAFSANALHLTARPRNWWLYFKGGITDVEFHTETTSRHSTGAVLGTGVLLGNGNIRLHLLDYQRLQLAHDSFNMLTISLVILLH